MIHGGSIKVKNSTTDTALVALAKSCTVEHKNDAVEVSPANGRDAREYVPGRNSWTVEVSGLVSSLSDIMIAGSIYNIEITDGSTTATGSAICTSVRQVGTIGHLAQQTCMFQGSGELT